MEKFAPLLQQYGYVIVFIAVMLEQAGLPVPAYPVLIVAGALAVGGDLHWLPIMLLCLAGSLFSDYFWFAAGRRFGKRILKVLCKISLSPDYCVGQTEDHFGRFGPKALIVAKFIPGFNTVAPPLVGAMGTPAPHFIGYTMLGSLLWGGSAVAIGMYFHASVDGVIDLLSTMGSTALAVLLVLLLIFVAIKYVDRRRFRKELDIERITMKELARLIADGEQPLLLDARSDTALQFEAPIPGAHIYNKSAPELLAGLDKERHIVVYCSCPNDATAARVAHDLAAMGFARARPLQGGLEAWHAHFATPDTAVQHG
ncbi:VTT domain-containing protein [Massilia sp. TS11]|uniref:VTT domain-containing protein n=1 Tax=Massilia sp. TS11 TaxID=2908003 RepID=UPI001EDAAA20|nr:VTT domain-containing protein [Massilia sp. TS11]MCG2585909.1 VTT domain-containing protein [Massilia sp. TS11]